MQSAPDETIPPLSSWGTAGPALVSLSAMYLFVFGDQWTGYFVLVCGLVVAWMCDFTTLTFGLFRDQLAIAVGIVVLDQISLRADLSNLGILSFAVALTAAVALPYLLLQYAFRDNPITFPWGSWRWNRAQWAYLGMVVVGGYLILPWYFVSSGVYRNWPAIHSPEELLRLFIGVNAVGIWDELFFICTVYVLNRRHFRAWQANLLQALIFVSFLWELGYQSWGPVLTIPFALVQGAIFQLTKNLKYVITVHLTFDLIVFLVLVHAHNPAWPHPFITG
ncbi:MAG: CPBP family intramembrane metalloprotease [Micropruina sp.]|nr:CPBP family intramembrane metalloprotease [Micropruina sp.]